MCSCKTSCPLYPRKRTCAVQLGDVRFVPIADIRAIYSITSSARASSDGGTVRPSALAVLRLITSSYLVGRLYRQIGWLFAFENTINIVRRAPKMVDSISGRSEIRPPATTAATKAVDSGQLVPCRKRRQSHDDELPMPRWVSQLGRHSESERKPPECVRCRRHHLYRLAAIPRRVSGAADWMAANWPIPARLLESRRTAARAKCGTISLRSSSHFPLKLYS